MFFNVFEGIFEQGDDMVIGQCIVDVLARTFFCDQVGLKEYL